MAGSINLLAVILALIHLTVAQDYCNIETCKTFHKGTQTMCKYPSSGPAQACLAKGDMGSGLSEDDKNTLIYVHNNYRHKVASGQEDRGDPGPQPAAESMPDLTWDDELAEVAQRWADQCFWDHDDCRDVERYQVGQNIAYLSTTGDANDLKLEDMVAFLYDEVKDFDPSIIPSFRSTNKMTGHYTQIVWAKTNKIGCGMRIYFDGNMNRKYLVCNFGPAGNMLSAPIYETA